MAHVKNVGGGPGDEDLRPPPHLSTEVKGKAKKTTTKKQKFVDADTERAAVVAAAIERVERERRSSVWCSRCRPAFTISEGRR